MKMAGIPVAKRYLMTVTTIARAACL